MSLLLKQRAIVELRVKQSTVPCGNKRIKRLSLRMLRLKKRLAQDAAAVVCLGGPRFRYMPVDLPVMIEPEY